MLQHLFTLTAATYTSNNTLVNTLWNEIEKAYTTPGRHYHTLEHLENMLEELIAVKQSLQNWNAVVFALYYHDIVYNTRSSNNEEKSATHATKILQQLNADQPTINACTDLIHATKHHTISENNDINLFTDADIAILGQPLDIYNQYTQNIRKEYSIYPSIIYNPGRKKVLQHFLSMTSIYKTPHFSRKYETQAKQNLQYELNTL